MTLANTPSRSPTKFGTSALSSNEVSNTTTHSPVDLCPEQLSDGLAGEGPVGSGGFSPRLCTRHVPRRVTAVVVRGHEALPVHVPAHAL